MNPRHLSIRQPFLHVNPVSAILLRLGAALVIICGLALPRTAQAWRHEGHRKTHESAYHIIKSVDEGKQTVTVGTEHSDDHTEKVLKVNNFTEITLDGAKATLHDLKSGMMIEFGEEADSVASTIDAKHHNK